MACSFHVVLWFCIRVALWCQPFWGKKGATKCKIINPDKLYGSKIYFHPKRNLKKGEQHCFDMLLIRMVTSYQAGRVWHAVLAMIMILPSTHTLPKL